MPKMKWKCLPPVLGYERKAGELMALGNWSESDALGVIFVIHANQT
jgi:hypothetical protein